MRRFVILVAGLALVACCAGGIAVTDLSYWFTEKAGTFTVTACTSHVQAKGHTVYDCTGGFTSADGTVRVPQLKLDDETYYPPGDTVRATVKGPGATDAHPIGVVHIAVFFTVMLAALVLLAALLLHRLRSRGSVPKT
jgi:hypothetical protein